MGSALKRTEAISPAVRFAELVDRMEGPARVDVLAAAARAALQAGDSDAAEGIWLLMLEGMTSTDTRADQLACEIASARIRAGSPAAARIAERLAQRGTPSVALSRIRAEAASRERRWSDAAAAWKEVLAQQPDEPIALAAWARCEERLGEIGRALEAYLALVRVDPSSANHMVAARVLQQHRADVESVPLALLTDFTATPLRQCLEVQCLLAGVPVRIFEGAFDQYAPLILDERSALYDAQPRLIFLVLTPERLLPGFPDQVPASSVDEAIAHLRLLLERLRQHSQARVVLHTIAPSWGSGGNLLDWQEPQGGTRHAYELSLRLAEIVREHPRVHLLDLESVVAQTGVANSLDPRMRALAAQPFAGPFLVALASHQARFVRAAIKAPKKCLVLDLDNTLWGGVLGEDGPDGIQLGESVGRAYQDFQRAILALARRGVLLALNSRNDEEEALRVIESHPDMILRRRHFAALRVNWSDKVSNLRELAADLNLGLDSLVFVDDDPFQRGLVRRELPEVLTPEPPADPAQYREWLVSLNAFDVLEVTEEDRQRGAMYHAERERRSLRQQSRSLEDYLASLDIRVEIRSADGFSVARVAQLIQRTNQFNMTGRRYDEAEVRSMASSPAHRVLTIRVQDRFGDSGLVGVALIEAGADAWLIDNFLLSCRILGRGIEDVLLDHVAGSAQRAGAARLRARFRATPRNTPARGFYQRASLNPAGVEGETEIWELDLSRYRPSPPNWVTISTEA